MDKELCDGCGKEHPVSHRMVGIGMLEDDWKTIAYCMTQYITNLSDDDDPAVVEHMKALVVNIVGIVDPQFLEDDEDA